MRTILSRLRHHGIDLRLYVPHFFRPYGRDVGWPGRHYSCISLFTCVILAHTRVFQGGFRMRRVCLFLSIGCWATIQAQMPPAGGEENPLRQGRPAAAGAEVLLLPRRGRSTILWVDFSDRVRKCPSAGHLLVAVVSRFPLSGAVEFEDGVHTDFPDSLRDGRLLIADNDFPLVFMTASSPSMAT